jgi:hypothetical protein
MTQPTDYVPSEEFGPFNPSAFPNLGLKLDVEFGNISTSVGEINDNLAMIQRDDGALANESVGVDQLKDELRAGINTPVSWLTATAYSVRDSVYFVVDGSTTWYKCVEAHTSGVFATDLASGYWVLILEAEKGDTGATGPAGAGTAGTATPTPIAASAGVVGVSTAFSREDHTHPYAAPVWSRKTDSYTVLATGELVLMDAATDKTVTAKATPSEGDEFSVARKGAGGVTIPRNGSTIADLAEDLTLSRQGDAVRLVYLNGAWRVFNIGAVA